MTSAFDQPVADEVLAGARGGDRAAHAALYDVFAVPVHTLATRIAGRPDVADEVLQETFVEVIRKIGRYRGDAPVGFWIRRIAVSKCLMHFRSSWRQRRDDCEPVELDRRAAEPADLANALDIERMLERLPDAARAVVWLHDVEGYTHREIGELMNRTASFSKSRLARAHAMLREFAEPRSASATEVKPCTRRSPSF
jgi:RNA polymerase sigma-70 factor (ECF subfamily)